VRAKETWSAATQQLIKDRWDRLLRDKPTPRYFREIVRRSTADFIAALDEEDFALQVIDSLHAGDVWILERSFTSAELATLREAALSFRASKAGGAENLVEGAADFHEIMDGSKAPRGGYVAVDHSAYFFRWNSAGAKIFKVVEHIWSLQKMFSGHAPHAFEANTPKDLFVDRVQFVQYPSGAGKITPHCDPHALMKIAVGIYLSTYGEDYQQGGFFVARGPGDYFPIDPLLKAGDTAVWFPGLIHGVETIDPHHAMDWDATTGRWFIALNTVESAYVEKRHVAVPA
jgi:hypothetical protein